MTAVVVAEMAAVVVLAVAVVPWGTREHGEKAWALASVTVPVDPGTDSPASSCVREGAKACYERLCRGARSKDTRGVGKTEINSHRTSFSLSLSLYLSIEVHHR